MFKRYTLTVKKILYKTLKIAGWILVSILAIIVLVLILIQVPAVQNFAKDKVVTYLQNKIHTKVEVQSLRIRFPKQIVLEKIYFEDQAKDTLLAGDKIQVDISLFKLLSNTVELNYLGLEGIRANVYRINNDTVFNYDYIIKAFATGDTTAQDSTAPMKFSIGKIELKRITTTFKDDNTGIDSYLYLGNFSTTIEKFDPYTSTFAIPNIALGNIVARIRQYKPLVEAKPVAQVEAESNEPIQMKLDLGTINLDSINAAYVNDVSVTNAEINLGKLTAVFNKMDLSKLIIPLQKLELSDTRVKLLLGKSQASKVVAKEVEKHVEAQVNNPWKISFQQLNFLNNEIQYDNNNNAPVAAGIDYRHMHVTKMNLDADSLEFTPSSFKANVQQLALTEKSGLNLVKFQTRFLYNDKQATLQDLLVQTDKSQIKRSVLLNYPSVESLSSKPGDVFVDANLDHCSIAAKDILLFAPQLAANLRGNENAIFAVNARATGYLKDLSLPTVEFSGLGSTAFSISGNIKGLPEADKAVYDIKIAKLATTKNDIERLAPPKTIPDNIRIPEKLSATGYFKGTVKTFKTSINARTSNGNADITATMSNGGKSYVATVATNDLDLGYILKQEQNIGKISLTADVKGNGTDYKTMTATAHTVVRSAELKGYTYTNLIMNAETNNGNAVVQSSVNDSNIRISLDAVADVKTKFPALKINMQVDTLDLNALHLVTGTLQLSGTVHADFTSTDPAAPQGLLEVYNLSVKQGLQSLSTDTITVEAARTDSGQLIKAHAEMADITWIGTYNVAEVGTALQHTINKFYTLPDFKDTVFAAQQWKLNATINPTSPLMLQFVPQLDGSDTAHLTVRFNSATDSLALLVNAPEIHYQDQLISGLSANATTAGSQLNYNLSVDNAGSKSLQLYRSTVYGSVTGNTINTSVLLQDKKGKDRYHLSTRLNQVANGVKMSLLPDSLLLNYDNWQAANGNYIQYDSNGIIAHDFMISNKNQSLRINSQSEVANAPLDISFKNFSIKTLTDFAEQDSLLMDGVIDGNAIVRNATKSPVFTSDLQINSFSYKKDTIGNITLKVDNETANAFNADVRILGNGNDIQLAGKYYTGEGRMDMKLNIANLNASTLTPFSAGQLTDAGGSLKGNVAISGTINKPEVGGSVHFENAYVVPAVSGERFTLTNEKINISSRGINFDHFTLVDSAGNKAIINGDVLTTDFKNYGFDVDLNADDFRVINTPQKNNSLFYGKLNIDAKVELRGDMNVPSVNANLKVNKLTDFTVVLPSNDPEVVSREGVVNFVDRDAPFDANAKPDSTAVLFNTAVLAGMDFSANIETDTSATFNLVIDERSRDALSVRGQADLSAGLDQSGKLSLTGNYEIQQGSYQVSFNFIKRKFLIQKGSVITWTGDPTSANIDITALYETLAPPIDLVAPQLGGLSVTEINVYKQRIPVQVFLKMSGELMKPVITFDIQLPADEATQWPIVDTKLNQVRTDESELNKQVFALLLLNRFVGENPLQSEAGATSTGTLLRQSVSSILADQLNQLAASLIRGVDVNFGLTSSDDYTTGTQETRTDLTVGVSKSLFNDRIKVSVGSNFELEGPANTNQSASNIAGDVAVDYQLSKDGKYVLRAYRRNDYEGVVEGQVIETGLTFIFTLDYDHFRELFAKKSPEAKELKKEAKQNKKEQAVKEAGQQ